jgi:hypothetical protein
MLNTLEKGSKNIMNLKIPLVLQVWGTIKKS